MASIQYWLRWLSFIPISLLGGTIVGLAVHYYVINGAVNEDAPLYFLAWFAGPLASNYFALYLIHRIVPDHKKIVTRIAATFSFTLALVVGFEVFRGGGWESGLNALGQIAASILAWKRLSWDMLELMPLEEEDFCR